jgi:hypothetical protein
LGLASAGSIPAFPTNNKFFTKNIYVCKSVLRETSIVLQDNILQKSCSKSSIPYLSQSRKKRRIRAAQTAKSLFFLGKFAPLPKNPLQAIQFETIVFLNKKSRLSSPFSFGRKLSYFQFKQGRLLCKSN